MSTWGPQHWAFLLAILGILLLFAEVLIPSMGMIFLSAVACLAGAVLCAWQAWWETDRMYFWWFVGGLATILPMAGYWMLKIWERMLFRTDEEEQQMTKPSPDAELWPLVGKTGRSVTPLMPSGIVVVDGERIHASSEGMIIERDQPVRVVDVRSNRLIVRVDDPNSRPASDLEPDSDLTADDVDDEGPLDFDVSEE